MVIGHKYLYTHLIYYMYVHLELFLTKVCMYKIQVKPRFKIMQLELDTGCADVIDCVHRLPNVKDICECLPTSLPP